MRYSLGVVDIVFGGVPPADAARRAAELGFEHIDLAAAAEAAAGEELALPVVDRFSPSPRAGCSTGAPPEGDGVWDRAVRAFRRVPDARIEPWPGSIVNSVEKVVAFLTEVPGLRLLLDTGHVATWGEDPAELIPYAGHVQLRQARAGCAQTLDGDIDFRDFFRRLRDADYNGALSVEYFDLPDWGWPLDDPLGHAVALAAELRPLL